MKAIAFISEHASPLAMLGGVDSGGQNVYVARLAEQLVQLGYRVDIYTRRSDTDTPSMVEWQKGIRVIHVAAGPASYVKKELLLGYMGEFTDNMLRYIKSHRLQYQLVHAHFFMSAIVASNLKRSLGIPYVVTFHALGLVRKMHQQEADGFPEERISIERLIINDADRLIAECPQDRDDMIHLYGADPSRIAVIPCGYDPKEFYPIQKSIARKYLQLPQSSRILLQLGRMVPRKGVDNVIRAMASLKGLKENVQLLIVGGESDDADPAKTPEIGRLQGIAEEMGVADKVRFMGRKSREMLKYFYSAADVFISTPWYEPFGITPLEAMACGTPVIGSNVGGIKYSVRHWKTGLLVPPKQPEALSKALNMLLADNTAYHAMCQNALKHVRNNFTWKDVASMIAEQYNYTVKKSMATNNEPLSFNNFLVELLESLTMRPLKNSIA